MKVKDLIFSRKENDITIITNYLAEKFPDYLDKEKAKKQFTLFKSECKKIEKKTLDPDLIDFVINISKHIEDDYEKMIYLENGDIDYENLPFYYIVDGIYLSKLMKFCNKLGTSYKRKSSDDTLTYGLDFMDRGDILNCEILELSFEKYDINTITAEIFWELTFYGLKNEDYKRTINEETEYIDETNKKYEETKDNPEEFKKYFVRLDKDLIMERDQKELDIIHAISIYNRKISENFLLEYIDKYKDTQISRLIKLKEKIKKEEEKK